MQKKLSLLILTLTSLLITSCGASHKSSVSQDISSDASQSTSENSSESSSSVHTHTYSNEWSKDGTHHWHAATCEHKDEKNCICDNIQYSELYRHQRIQSRHKGLKGINSKCRDLEYSDAYGTDDNSKQ